MLRPYVNVRMRCTTVLANVTAASHACDAQAASNSKNLDIGANLFIGNLDPEIDEKLLYDTFSAFGVILETPKVFMQCASHMLQCFGGV